jgi:phage terminase large subunit-like protein
MVEDKANGPAVISSLRKLVSGLVAYQPPSEIVSRVRAIAPVLESGSVYLPPPEWERARYDYWRRVASEPGGEWLPLKYVVPNWVDGIVGEWEAVPKGANDDRVIAGVQALEVLEQGSAADDITQQLAADERTTGPSETFQMVSQKF